MSDIPSTVTRRTLLLGTAGTAGMLALPGTAHGAPGGTGGGAAAHGPRAAARWVRAANEVVALQGVSPPAASRVYTTVAVAMYESVVPGMPAHRSLRGQLHGLSAVPRPAAPALLHWPSVLGQAAAAALHGSFPDMREAARAVVARALARDDEDARCAGVASRRAGVRTRRERASGQHGRAVARAVLDWVATDGHAESLQRPYTPPQGEGLWTPTPPRFGRAVEPWFTGVRPLVLLSSGEVRPADPVPFSSAPGSPFWEQAKATYDQSARGTDDQRDLAWFWADSPLLSGTPAGHWLSIAVQVAEQRGLRLDTTLDAVVRTAVALQDAFLSCWTWKYRHHVLRPVTYVQRYLDPGWRPLVDTPQFPEHTSGHSVASRAAATVLTDLLGDRPFDDTALATTPGIVRRTRRWRGFSDAAEAAALSRLYGGIHFPHGVEAGLTHGDEVGSLVVARLRTGR